MKQYIERMKVESKELENRIKKNLQIIENPPYDSDETGLGMLKKQVSAMRAYADILTERINYEVSK